MKIETQSETRCAYCGLTAADLIHRKIEARERGFDEELFPDSEFHDFISPESGYQPIKPIGLKIIDHPRFHEWLKCGLARQEPDGLWLHYSLVCTLLKESARS